MKSQFPEGLRKPAVDEITHSREAPAVLLQARNQSITKFTVLVIGARTDKSHRAEACLWNASLWNISLKMLFDTV